MIRKTWCIAIVASMLLSLMSIVHARPIELEAGLQHSSKDATESILPRFSERPGTRGQIVARYPIGLTVFSGSISTTVHAQNDQGQSMGDMESMNGHTNISFGAKRKIDAMPLNLSVQYMYMHTNTKMSQSHFRGNAYETVLKAELTTSAQKPYIFLGLITPDAYIPVTEGIGLGGIGLSTETPVHKNVTICTNSSIATTMLNIGMEQETVLQSSIELKVKPQDAVKIGIGFNLFQDVRREKYCTWWGINGSYTF